MEGYAWEDLMNQPGIGIFATFTFHRQELSHMSTLT